MTILQKNVVGLDLFCGAGGMTLGAKMAGINVAFAVESDTNAAMTYSENHPEVQLYAKDIRKLRKVPDFPRGKETILFGGPPCQGFSTSNQRTRTRENRNNWMFKEFVRISKNWRPDWILFENVKGIAETENGAFLDLILSHFSKIGYTLSTGVLNAANYGVPQKRERLFVIGSLNGIEVKMPKIKLKVIPLKYAISDLPDLLNGDSFERLPYKAAPRNSYARLLRNGSKHSLGNLVTKNADFVVDRYKHVKQGGNWENIPKRLMGNYRENYECHTGIYHRLDPEKPSIVIGNYRKNMLIHPNQNRGLSVREAARIQSFPDCYKFTGSIGFQQQQVGNAVPPLLAKAVFSEILKHIKS